MERDNVTSVLSAFALGGLAGATLALLYAPRPGEETRRRIGEQVKRGAELGREKLREGAEFTREKIEQGAELGRQMAQKVSGKAEELASAAAEIAESEASPFGERRRKSRTLSPEMPQP